LFENETQLHYKVNTIPGVTNLHVTESYFLRPINAKGYYSLIHTSEIEI